MGVKDEKEETSLSGSMGVRGASGRPLHSTSPNFAFAQTASSVDGVDLVHGGYEGALRKCVAADSSVRGRRRPTRRRREALCTRSTWRRRWSWPWQTTASSSTANTAPATTPTTSTAPAWQRRLIRLAISPERLVVLMRERRERALERRRKSATISMMCETVERAARNE
jgi:hypothetical protein